MSLKGAKGEAEMKETMEYEKTNFTLLSNSKCEDEQSDPNTEMDNSNDIIPSCRIKKEPGPGEELQHDLHLKGEHLSLSLKEEEIEFEEHKPGWEVTRRSTAGKFSDGLDQGGSVQKSELQFLENRKKPKQCMRSMNTYKCHECSFKTRNKGDLTRHYKNKHSKEAEVYKCEECSYETRYKGNLTKHHKCKHSKEAEVYKCQECAYETRDKSHFTQHHKQHSTDAEVYRCQECSFKTIYRNNFTVHYKNKHSKEVEVLRCQECSYKTKDKNYLTRHCKCKHSKNAEVYRCHECSFETKYKSDLTRHYKRKHAKEVECHDS